jgi:hypothetical protein
VARAWAFQESTMMLWGFVPRGWFKMGMEELVRLGGPLSPEADRARGEVGADPRTDFLLGAGLEPDIWAGSASEGPQPTASRWRCAASTASKN